MKLGTSTTVMRADVEMRVSPRHAIFKSSVKMLMRDLNTASDGVAGHWYDCDVRRRGNVRFA